MLRLAIFLGRPRLTNSSHSGQRWLPAGAFSVARRAAAAASASGVPTGPAGGYNDPEECGIADESERQLQEDRKAAERLAAQVRCIQAGSNWPAG